MSPERFNCFEAGFSMISIVRFVSCGSKFGGMLFAETVFERASDHCRQIPIERKEISLRFVGKVRRRRDGVVSGDHFEGIDPVIALTGALEAIKCITLRGFDLEQNAWRNNASSFYQR